MLNHQNPDHEDFDENAPTQAEKGAAGLMATSDQVIGFVLYRFQYDAGTSGGKEYEKGSKPLKPTGISDGSGATRARLGNGNVKLQMSLAPLKFTNSKGNQAYVVVNHVIRRSELDVLTQDNPLSISTFTNSGNALPLNAKVFVGGTPSDEQLAKARKIKKRKRSA